MVHNMGQFIQWEDSPWAVSCLHFKQMKSSLLQKMLPPVWDPSCRAFLIPAWGASELLQHGQAGDICWLQEQQQSPFPKHPVCPKAAASTPTRTQVPPTALTLPFLPGQQNPPKPTPVPAPRHPTTTIFLQQPMVTVVVPLTAIIYQGVPGNT